MVWKKKENGKTASQRTARSAASGPASSRTQSHSAAAAPRAAAFARRSPAMTALPVSARRAPISSGKRGKNATLDCPCGVEPVAALDDGHVPPGVPAEQGAERKAVRQVALRPRLQADGQEADRAGGDQEDREAGEREVADGAGQRHPLRLKATGRSPAAAWARGFRGPRDAPASAGPPGAARSSAPARTAIPPSAAAHAHGERQPTSAAAAVRKIDGAIPRPVARQNGTRRIRVRPAA